MQIETSAVAGVITNIIFLGSCDVVFFHSLAVTVCQFCLGKEFFVALYLLVKSRTKTDK
jgi:hypothetical protein